jgi:hypothetical protein
MRGGTIAVAILMAVLIGGCGVTSNEDHTQSPTPTVVVTPTPTQTPLTKAESQVLDVVMDNEDRLDTLLDDTKAFVNDISLYTYSQATEEMLRMDGELSDINRIYKRSNGGEYAGGQVSKLEVAFERVMKAEGVCLRELMKAWGDSDINVERWWTSMERAQKYMQVVHDEGERLSAEQYQ